MEDIGCPNLFGYSTPDESGRPERLSQPESYALTVTEVLPGEGYFA